MIDYHSIINEEFEFSRVLMKNRKILIIWYEYERGVDPGDFVIWNYQLYDMSQDMDIIENDFYIIREKAINGDAHLLSEGDTSYLGAATKASDGSVRVSQPNSEKLARPRAFSLKNSYMRGILRSYDEEIREKEASYKTVIDYVMDHIEPYIGLTQIEIYEKLSGKRIKGNVPKQIGKMVSDLLIGKDNELEQKHDLFKKTTYNIKNVPVDENYNLVERHSFRNIVQSEFKEPWDESNWKRYFEEVTILLICYEGRYKKNGYRKLKGLKKLTFIADDIDNFGESYNMVQQAIKEKDIQLLPYPKSFPNQALEIAPKGVRGDDAYNTFFDNDRTKVCFMMDKDFVRRKID